MANPFDNLLNASLATSQMRQGYNQLAVQDKQATGSLLQRRAEQEQQNRQFIMSLNQQKSEQAMKADQFNRSLNFNYSQLRQQDKWANAEDKFRWASFKESVNQFGQKIALEERQVKNAESQTSAYGADVALRNKIHELTWPYQKRELELGLRSGGLDLVERLEARQGPSRPAVAPFENFWEKANKEKWYTDSALGQAVGKGVLSKATQRAANAESGGLLANIWSSDRDAEIRNKAVSLWNSSPDKKRFEQGIETLFKSTDKHGGLTGSGLVQFENLLDAYNQVKYLYPENKRKEFEQKLQMIQAYLPSQQAPKE